MSLFLTQEEGYYILTTGGIIAAVIVTGILLIAASFWKNREKAGEESAKEGKKSFSAKQLVFCAAAIALGFATSYIKLFSMPWGGSVTLCSMLFVTLIGYWYGLRAGLTAGLAYGLLQFVQGGRTYILSPLQVGLDYIFAFAALGLSGVFHNKPKGLVKGYILAILARGFFHAIGGYLYWMEYMPENFPKFLEKLYPFAYNYAYILAEGIITIVILCLPPVKNAMARVKEMAQEQNSRKTNICSKGY